MVELKDKTVEELRKMASRKKIEGRSKMNKSELVRALKKKNSSKKMKGGENGLSNNLIGEIYKYTSCKDFFRDVPKLSKVTLNKINWDLLPQIPFDVSPEVNLNIDCAICNFIENEGNRQKCKIYYNKCRILDLFKKYMIGRHIGPLVNIGGLTNLLVATIPNTGNMNSVRNDQEFLRRLGVVYNDIRDVGSGMVKLTSATIPNYVRGIGRGSFSKNELTSIEIPHSVTFIGAGAFAYNKLISVTIPNSVTIIEDYAFYNNQLTTVIIPDSITKIENHAFKNNHLTSITIPNSVTKIGVEAFANNYLTSVTIPDSVKEIVASAFENNRLTSVFIPNSVTEISPSVFKNNNLTSVTIPNSVIKIYSQAFYNNPLNSVTLPRRFEPRTLNQIDVLRKAFGYDNYTSINFIFTD
jgi:hypothetical protein